MSEEAPDTKGTSLDGPGPEETAEKPKRRLFTRSDEKKKEIAEKRKAKAEKVAAKKAEKEEQRKKKAAEKAEYRKSRSDASQAKKEEKLAAKQAKKDEKEAKKLRKALAAVPEADEQEDKLFGREPDENGIDINFDLVMEESLAKNEYPKEKLNAARAADHTSLAAKFCTQEIWDQYKDTVSSGPAKWTLARAINSGTLYPSSFVGCHAGDRESYDDFRDFFYPVIEAYHKGF
eukprot:CAMPEP_0172589612 /NCGR_PEP_ID=MMETSP1068-20121228/8274_1 /TAXON_ID=35684 /ORGANISM="Pseudopedinella elastica, Strain CCMP716" /LENGTH=232 /DNA_ID=CAMNT_0013385237 /DNA_START=63 /DNA_END=758 /DNA_ORIENTATION=+